MSSIFPYDKESYRQLKNGEALGATPCVIPPAMVLLSTAIKEDLKQLFKDLAPAIDLNEIKFVPPSFSPEDQRSIERNVFRLIYFEVDDLNHGDSKEVFCLRELGCKLIFDCLPDWLSASAEKTDGSSEAGVYEMLLEAIIRALMLCGRTEEAWGLHLQRACARLLSRPKELKLKPGKDKSTARLRRRLAMLNVASRLLAEWEIPTKLTLYSEAGKLLGEAPPSSETASRDRKGMKIFKVIPNHPKNRKGLYSTSVCNEFFDASKGVFRWRQMVPVPCKEPVGYEVMLMKGVASLIAVEPKPSDRRLALYWHALDVLNVWPLERYEPYVELDCILDLLEGLLRRFGCEDPPGNPR